VETELGDILTRWSVRAAVICYLIRAWADVVGPGPPGTSTIKAIRWVWTLGFALYAVHVYAAFEFFHKWSHQSALRHTAEQTAAVTGIIWGGGLYVNYAFSLLWMLDVGAWWVGGPLFPYRGVAYRFGLHVVFAFMMFNATVVFGPPIWRWAAVPVAVAAIAIIGMSRRRNRLTATDA
jgi:hypothetical protein